MVSIILKHFPHKSSSAWSNWLTSLNLLFQRLSSFSINVFACSNNTFDFLRYSFLLRMTEIQKIIIMYLLVMHYNFVVVIQHYHLLIIHLPRLYYVRVFFEKIFVHQQSKFVIIQERVVRIISHEKKKPIICKCELCS